MHVNTFVPIRNSVAAFSCSYFLRWGIPASGMLFKYVTNNISLLSAIHFCGLSTFESLRVYLLYDLIELLNFFAEFKECWLCLSDCFPVWYARTNIRTRRGLGPTTGVQVQLFSITLNYVCCQSFFSTTIQASATAIYTKNHGCLCQTSAH